MMLSGVASASECHCSVSVSEDALASSRWSSSVTVWGRFSGMLWHVHT